MAGGGWCYNMWWAEVAHRKKAQSLPLGPPRQADPLLRPVSHAGPQVGPAPAPAPAPGPGTQRTLRPPRPVACAPGCPTQHASGPAWYHAPCTEAGGGGGSSSVRGGGSSVGRGEGGGSSTRGARGGSSSRGGEGGGQNGAVRQADEKALWHHAVMCHAPRLRPATCPSSCRCPSTAPSCLAGIMAPPRPLIPPP